MTSDTSSFSQVRDSVRLSADELGSYHHDEHVRDGAPLTFIWKLVCSAYSLRLTMSPGICYFNFPLSEIVN